MISKVTYENSLKLKSGDNVSEEDLKQGLNMNERDPGYQVYIQEEREQNIKRRMMKKIMMKMGKKVRSCPRPKL